MVCTKIIAAKVLYVLTFISYIGVLLINYLASQGPKGPFKFLHKTNVEMADKYYLEITPANSTFSIWGFIYAWQALWLCYALSLLCRHDAPLVLSPMFCILYIASSIFNASWVISFGMEEITAACVLLFAIVASLYAALATVYRSVRKLGEGTLPRGDYNAVQSLVINGIAFYSTWVTIASLLNLAIVLTYKAGMNQQDACTLALAFLACEIAAWFCLDILVLNSMTKFTVSPWVVLIVALTGSISKNYVPGKRNSILTVVLLCIVGVLAIVRVLVFACRVHRDKKPPKQIVHFIIKSKDL